jgi:hypothetical protein
LTEVGLFSVSGTGGAASEVLTHRALGADPPAPVPLSAWEKVSPVAVRLAWVAVGVGEFLRIRNYVANRSVAIDESFLALNVIQKTPGQLLHALAFKQAAPLGFLEAEKLAVTVFGRSEHALRLLPLLVSLGALLLFMRVALSLLHPLAAALAVAVFALLDPLIYYSATAKQYSFDVLAIVLVLLVALRFEDRRPARRELVALAPLGAILVWFSHAAAFGLAGLGVLLVLEPLRRRDTGRLSALGAVFAIWIASFAVEYELSKANLGRILGAFHGSGTVVAQTAGGGRVAHALDKLRYVVGLEDTSSGKPILGFLPDAVNRGLTLALVVVAAIGLVALLRSRPRLWLVLVIPPAVAIVASAFQRYPLAGRTVLFTLPAVALFLGAGAYTLGRWRSPLGRPAAAAALVALAAIAVLPTLHAVRTRSDEEMKPVLGYLGAHHRAGDALVVSSSAQYALAYYHLCDCSAFDPATAWPLSTTTRAGAAAIVSRSPDLIVQNGEGTAGMATLQGRKRVWILFAEGDRETLLDYLARHGKLLQSFHSSGPSAIAAAVYLYDLAR